MRKTILIPILLGAFGTLHALAPGHLESSLDDHSLPGNVLPVPGASKTYTGLKRSMNGATLTILTPFAAGQVGGAFFPMEQAFDGQPSWDATSGSPNGGTGGANAPSFNDRYGYIDFGTGYADLRITATWTQYTAWSNGDQTPYAEIWWDDDTDNINDGTVETRLNFNSAQGLTGTANEQWVEDSNHELSPITPAARYLICRSPLSMTARAKEYAIVGYTESLPAAPSGLAATSVGSSQVTLTWTDNSNNETGFEIERSPTAGSSFTLLHTTLANATGYTDTGLTAGTSYYYRVRAVNASGTSAYSPELTVTTTTDVSVGTIILTPIAAGQAGPTFFPMEAAFDDPPTWDATTQAPIGGTGGTAAPTFSDRYGYIDFGEGYAELRITGTWTLYTAWKGGDHTPFANLWWDDDPDNVNDNGFTETQLNFNTALNLPNTGEEQWVEDTNHELSPITPPARYLICQTPANMRVGAKEYAFVGYQEAAPAAPTGLTTIAIGSTQVALAWTDNSTNETGFEIERSITPGNGYTVVHTTGPDETTYTDTGLTPTATYYYRVRALSTSGASVYSPELTVVTMDVNTDLVIITPTNAGQAGTAFYPFQNAFDEEPSWNTDTQAPATTTTGSNVPTFENRFGYVDFGADYANVRITGTWTLYAPWSGGDHDHFAELWWDDDTDDVNDGTVESRLNFNTAQNLPNTGDELWVEDTNYELTPITPQAQYLILRTPSAMRPGPKEHAFVGYIESPPEAPSLLEVLHVDENSIRLGWQDGSNNEVGFSIERSTNLTTGYAVIGTTERDITQYEDAGLPSNTTYYYRVQALNALGASPYTEPVEVSTTQNVAATTDLTHDPRHNGSITAIKWKYFGDDEERLYTYHYDEASQLEAAQYATGLTSPTTGSWTTSQAGGFSVPGISYDRNGNITSLKRQADEEGVRTIDALSYAYAEGNQLVAVSDLTGWSGFADKHSTGNDYMYDDNGNLIKDENQGIDSIVYNHMDLPERIYKNTGEYILYSYDAAGVKLSEELYNAQGERTKRTDYLGEFIFENGELKQVHHEEGRIVPDATTGGFEYQYFLRDHLGNNRVVVSATPKTHTFTLNYEGEGDDQPLFQEVTIREDDRFDHTDMLDTTYTHAQILNANEGSRVGSVIALPVHAGDTLTASVFAKYVEITPDASNVVTSLAANLISAFTGSSGSMSEMGNGTINTNFGDGSLIGTTGFPLEDVNGPMAFLNVMFLPNEEVIDLEKDVTFAYKQLNAAATQRLDQPKNANFDELRIDNFVAPGQGYILVYLSNESTTFTEVYFDDLSIELSQHNVTQKDDYYPFGLSFNSYRRPELENKNEYLYQGKEELEGTDWYDFHARNYHAALGRFMSIDPVYNGPSGYVGMLNNPVSTVDPDGEDPVTLTAIAIAVAVSATSYTASIALSDGGFNNWDWGQFGTSVFVGAVSGAITFGIGTEFKSAIKAAASNSSKVAILKVAKVATHATFQGGLSAGQGGDFWTSFASGAVGGAVGLGTENLTGTAGHVTSIGSAMLLGGATAEFTGGEFWKGAAISGIVAGANDVAHRLGHNLEQRIRFRQAQKRGLIPVNLSLNNAGERLLYNLREIYSDYQGNGSVDRQRYELSDAVDLSTHLSGIFDRAGTGSQTSGEKMIAGMKVRITIVQYQDNNGIYLVGGENQFTGLRPDFQDPLVYSNRIVFSVKIDPSITFSITTPHNQQAVNTAQNHLENMARFIYSRPTPGFKLSTSSPYGN